MYFSWTGVNFFIKRTLSKIFCFVFFANICKRLIRQSYTLRQWEQSSDCPFVPHRMMGTSRKTNVSGQKDWTPGFLFCSELVVSSSRVVTHFFAVLKRPFTKSQITPPTMRSFNNSWISGPKAIQKLFQHVATKHLMEFGSTMPQRINPMMAVTITRWGDPNMKRRVWFINISTKFAKIFMNQTFQRTLVSLFWAHQSRYTSWDSKCYGVILEKPH